MPFIFPQVLVEQTHDLQIAWCRDGTGENWIPPVAIATNVNDQGAAVWRHGAGYQCLYQRSGVTYQKGSTSPSDWSAAVESNNPPYGIGVIYGIARSDQGVVVVVTAGAILGVNANIWLSRDAGGTWRPSSRIIYTGGAQMQVLWVPDYFIILVPDSNGSMRHYLSFDHGETWD